MARDHYRNVTSADYADITDDDLRRFETQVNEDEAARRAAIAAKDAMIAEAHRLVVEVFGRGSNEERYIKKLRAPVPYKSPSFTLSCIKDSVRSAREKLAVEQRTKQADEDRRTYYLKCAQFLAANGVDIATMSPDEIESHAIELGRKKAIEQRGHGPYSFVGEDNCEGCVGWDGEDRRCMCGNRRVSWVFDGPPWDTMCYAEAW